MLRPLVSSVVSDRPGVKALERAEAHGVACDVVDWSSFPDRESFSTTLADRVESSGAKLVVLAGFMRILSPGFVDRFEDRILNVHPSLLPAFPGKSAVEDALTHGVHVSGLTVHLVDHKVDHGPIVKQVAVDVAADDSVESLHARIQKEEHQVYPDVIEAMVQGRLVVEGRRVRWV